jgi:NhaA family Na+:H+ antiporter
MRRYLPFVIVATVAVVTVGSATLLYRAKQRPVLTITKDQTESQKNGTDSVHARGRADAPVTLEEFGDFQCPPCGKLADPINQLERDYDQRLRVIFRHFPLIMHQHARAAALAAEAAAQQGRFWEMHDVLYREQSTWSKVPDPQTLFKAYAGMLRLNVSRFEKDMESDNVKARVMSDQQHGTKLGVTTTPTIFVNNRALPASSLNPDGLRAAIEAALKEKSPGTTR